MEAFPYSVYSKDRNLRGGGVMLIIHKVISHMPIIELENNSESVWVKVFANKNKPSHFGASWYRLPNGTLEHFDHLFREKLYKIRNKHKGNKPRSVHVLGDFNFRNSVWSDRLNKYGLALSQSERQMLIDIMNDDGLEQLVHFTTIELLLSLFKIQDTRYKKLYLTSVIVKQLTLAISYFPTNMSIKITASKAAVKERSCYHIC